MVYRAIKGDVAGKTTVMTGARLEQIHASGLLEPLGSKMTQRLGVADNGPTCALLDGLANDGIADPVSRKAVNDTHSGRSSSERREELRSKLFLAAVLDHEGVSTPVRIRNLSAGGALVEGHGLPFANADVQLRRGTHIVLGKVAWSEGSRAGLQFFAALESTDWLPKPSQQHQELTDRRFAQAQSKGAVPLEGTATTLTDAETNQRISEEVLLIVRTLEAIGEELSADPILLGRHGVTLQKLDVAAQSLTHLARVTAANDRPGEIEAITMNALKRRLLRRPL